MVSNMPRITDIGELRECTIYTEKAVTEPDTVGNSGRAIYKGVDTLGIKRRPATPQAFDNTLVEILGVTTPVTLWREMTTVLDAADGLALETFSSSSLYENPA